MGNIFITLFLVVVMSLGSAIRGVINLPYKNCTDSLTDLLLITDTEMPDGYIGPQEFKTFLNEIVDLYLPLTDTPTSRLRMSVIYYTPTGHTTLLYFQNNTHSDIIRQNIANLTCCDVPQSTSKLTESANFLSADFINNAFSEEQGGRARANHVAIIIVNGQIFGAIDDVEKIHNDKFANIKLLVILIHPDIVYKNALYPNIITFVDFSSLLGNQLISIALCRKCSPGWAQLKQTSPFYQHSCYYLDFDPDKTLNWFQSSIKCETLGSNLASIETQTELEFLQGELYDALVKQGDFSLKWEVFIGLRRDYKILPKRFKWINGRPLVWSHWQDGRPHGGYSHECGIWKYQPPDLENVKLESFFQDRKKGMDGWDNIGCGVPQSHFSLCEVTLENLSEGDELILEVIPARMESVASALSRGEFIEFMGNIVSIAANVENPDFYDAFNHNINDKLPVFDCEEDEDKIKVISYSYVCDYIQQCSNDRDEEFCLYGRCDRSHEFECRSGQCVPRESQCDAYADCYDQSDEDGCTDCKQRRCCGGSCVPKHWFSDDFDCNWCLHGDEIIEANRTTSQNSDEICSFICNRSSCVTPSQLGDGVLDCQGPEGPLDETIGNLKRVYSCAPAAWAPLCVYVKDRYGGVLGCSDMSNLLNCENFTCPEGYIKCPKSYCIPLHLVLDGNMDCPLGEDEQYWTEHNCTGNFACWGSHVCLHPDLVCDGNPDCPFRDDEKNCHVTCEDGFRCISGTVKVTTYNRETPLQSLAFIDIGTQYLDLSGIDVSLAFFRHEKRYLNNIMIIILSSCQIMSVDASFASDVSSLKSVYYLDISYNRIAKVHSNSIFKFMTNLRILNVSHNNYLTSLEENALVAYYGKSMLERIDLSYTSISVLESSVLKNLDRLKVLDISYTLITRLSDNSFPKYFKLRELYLLGTSIMDFNVNSFNGLIINGGLYIDSYELCCPQIRGSGIEEQVCHAPNDAISTCFDLIGLTVQRVLLWLVGIVAAIGNLTVIICRLTWNKGVTTTAYGIFVTNLGISDLIMGLYLLMIASADIYYRDIYVLNIILWKHSTVCYIAGFLSTISSETSAFFILLITIDRFLVLKFPFGQYSFSKRCAYIASALAWCAGFSLALVPTLPAFNEWTIFYSNGMCLGLPLDTKRLGGWEYSVAIFVGLNTIMFLFIAAGQISIYRAISVNRVAQSSIRSGNRRAQDIAVAKQLSLVVLTDFLCYFPVGLMGLLAITGHDVGKDAYAWSAVLVLPINSAINPMLYTIPFIEAKWEQFKMSHCRRRSPSTGNINKKQTAVMSTNQITDICRQIKTQSL